MRLKHAKLSLFVLALLSLPLGSYSLADEGGQPLEQKKACAEYHEELDKVRSCNSDDDCGQPIKGTSCGCTRDLVARKDADLSRLSYLKRAAQEVLESGHQVPAQCRDLRVLSTCDCPEADGFVCVNHLCTWNYSKVQTPPEPGPGTEPKNPSGIVQ